MRIVSHRKLREFYETPWKEESRVALERWYEMVSESEWRTFADMKTDFGTVDAVGNQHYVFKVQYAVACISASFLFRAE